MRGGLATLGHNLMPNLADIPLHALHAQTRPPVRICRLGACAGMVVELEGLGTKTRPLHSALILSPLLKR